MKDRNIDKRWESDKDSSDAVIAAIERCLVRHHMFNCALWTIGVAATPDRRQQELKFPSFWRVWKVPDHLVAQKVVAHFVSKGMQGDLVTEAHGRFVCLF